jgi:Glyoxalase-like domain
VASVPTTLDHLVYATPSLERTLDDIEAAFGIRPLAGGTHPAWGTRNAILPLSPTTYLELIGPDPGRRPATRPPIFGLATLTTPCLATWAAKGTHLGLLVAKALTRGLRLGLPAPGTRQQADGTTLSWELTDPLQVVERGLVPFFIDWGASPHPAAAAAAAVALTDFHAEHPDPEVLRSKLHAIGLDLRVDPGSRPSLVATFRTPRGLVTLR